VKHLALFSLLAALLSMPVVASAESEAVRAIQIAESHRTLDPILVTDLDASPALAARAALAIGRVKNIDGAPPLRAHLNSSVAGVRAMVAYGLGLLVDRASLGELMALARNDVNSAVRYAAIDAVGRIVFVDPHLVTASLVNDALIVARADANPLVRAHAMAQFDAFRSTPFARTIAASLERAQDRERDETVRWHTAWAIFRGYANVVDAPFLTRALHDPNETVRVEAARAWGRRSDTGAARTVRTALNDPSWRVQLEAREALRRLAGLAPTEHLLAIPQGIRLPKIPAIATTLPPAHLRNNSDAPSAPDPTTLALVEPVLPVAASDLARPQSGAHPRALVTTTKGDVIVRLFPEWAPETVANFLNLAARGYFNGNRWFRIVPDFVVQTGDPTDNGEGDAPRRTRSSSAAVRSLWD
jgi:HEAT repeat protein